MEDILAPVVGVLAVCGAFFVALTERALSRLSERASKLESAQADDAESLSLLAGQSRRLQEDLTALAKAVSAQAQAQAQAKKPGRKPAAKKA